MPNCVGLAEEAFQAVRLFGTNQLRVKPFAPTVAKGADDAAALAEAAALAAEAAAAVDDANGSAEYKEQLVRVLVERCFRDASGSR